MRIRFLAAAVVTAGALMATLTGAANASDDPAPATPEAAFTIVCEAGDDQGAVAVRKLTDAELKDLQAKAGHWRKAIGHGPVKVTGGTGHLASVKVTEATGPGPVKVTETTEAPDRVPSTTEAPDRVPSTTEAPDWVPATPAVPATPLDPSKQAEAEVARATTVTVSPLEEGETRLDVISDDVRQSGRAAAAKDVPGAPLSEGVVVACAQKAERAQEPAKAGE
ncbi:hypothetical protein [Streptosporangium roseum]|uniref:Secreted protein n=1 Tax=Streptosporangium roseum (strain ATCC 12428 / DSM 43021 / JCM 3005 / KCTC 9067 / NCIMB 10171 / NRRL 2505 / NI 9100) TaxID=479432 RepID=D2AXH9_STRRD|nr:hypothetical protein [Streptosporangium roseum]ACZ83159.1 hypothetical protein Sros_0103 [Streptosporangium roseum DSM 43021]